jgi:hypothetical protein
MDTCNQNQSLATNSKLFPAILAIRFSSERTRSVHTASLDSWLAYCYMACVNDTEIVYLTRHSE